MKTEEKKLLDWQEQIEELKTKTTELKTKTQMLEKQLAEYGIKDPAKAIAKIQELNKKLSELAETIDAGIQEIEDNFNISDE